MVWNVVCVLDATGDQLWKQRDHSDEDSDVNQLLTEKSGARQPTSAGPSQDGKLNPQFTVQ